VKTAEQIAAEALEKHASIHAERLSGANALTIAIAAIEADRAQAVVPGGPEQIAHGVLEQWSRSGWTTAQAMARAVTAGIDAAWSSWEPESVPHTPEPWTNDDGIEFEPFTTDRAAGIWVTDTYGRRECVRLEPSDSHGYNPDNGATADVFLYHGDAAEEDSVTYVNLFEGTGPEDDDE
jgi:hypothetical protein